MKILDISLSGERSEYDGHRKNALETSIFRQNMDADITGNSRCKLILVLLFLLELSLLYA